MGRNRITFTESFKKDVAIEALKEQMPVNEIVAKYGTVASMVSNWKKEFATGSFSKEVRQLIKIAIFYYLLLKPVRFLR